MDWRRIVAIAAVVGVHACGLVLLTRPTGHIQQYRFHRRGGAADALQVRLIPAQTVQPPILVPKLPKARFAPQVARKPLTRTQRHATPPVAAQTEPSHRRLVLSLPSSWTRQQRKQDGQSPKRNLVARKRASPQLPGSAEPVPGAPVFAMVDPRYQGVAGALRIIQSLFGVVNPHCVDVDTWRGMTPEERLRRHISAREVERTARDYGCTDPRAGRTPPDPSGH